MENNEENEVVKQDSEQVNQEELIKIWIGDKADEMYPKMQRTYAFNWCAMLFGVFYLAYRKMYLIALIAYLIGTVLSKIGTGATWLFWIAIGFVFYPLYKWDINRKLKDCEYQHKSLEETKEFARKKGGTSVGAVFVCLIPFIILITILIISSGIIVMNALNTPVIR